MIHQPKEDARIAVIGVPGQGKSFWRNRYLGTMYRCTLWDPMRSYSLGPIISVEEYARNIDKMRKGALHVTVEPLSYDSETMEEEFDALCAYVEEVGAQHFAIEEIALVTNPVQVPGHLNRLYVRGRHRFVSLSAYGQRFHQFPLIVRGTASEIIAFRQTDPDDVSDFEKRIRPHFSPVRLNELPNYHFIKWTPDKGPQFFKPLPQYNEGVKNNASRKSSTNLGLDGRSDDGGSVSNSGYKETNRPNVAIA